MEAVHVIPKYVTSSIEHLDHFAIENIKTARRFLRRMGYRGDFDSCEFYEIGKHGTHRDTDLAIEALKSGKDVGLLSEAGMPGIADPGGKLVLKAHRAGIKVWPLVGPSSILLALVASGFNGQSFSFHGYLPIDKRERQAKLKQLESWARGGQTQIFMETPFRNRGIMEDLAKHLNPETLVCIAADITTESESIRTMSVSDWKKDKEDFHKRPAIFLIGHDRY